MELEFFQIVDIGSTSTINYSEKYFDIQDALRPELNPSSSTLGKTVKPLGCETFPIVIVLLNYKYLDLISWLSSSVQ